MIPDARELVEPLLGTTVVTLAEREPNDVLAIRGANVVVGTRKPPEGANVPRRIIQQGLDILFSEGEVRITPETFGRVRRSSFVGVALGTTDLDRHAEAVENLADKEQRRIATPLVLELAKPQHFANNVFDCHGESRRTEFGPVTRGQEVGHAPVPTSLALAQGFDPVEARKEIV
jgi:hypothetical protein